MIIDSHIHISNFAYENIFPYLAFEQGVFVVDHGNRDELIALFREAGLGALIDPAIEFESNARLLKLAGKYPDFIYPVIGIHPTRTFRYITVENGKRIEKRLRFAQRSAVEEMASMPGVVAIGETGLDYHHARKDQHRLRQKLWFVWHIKLADRLGLPLVLHIREADDDALRILRRHKRYLHRGVCHCFSGNAETARRFTDLGLSIGIGGMLLSKYDERLSLEEAVAELPLERILVETDGPYVKPDCPGISGKQLRKARNTSLILPEIINRIAEIKGLDPCEVERVTTLNAIRLFNLENLSE